jgi:hypothetical protein
MGCDAEIFHEALVPPSRRTFHGVIRGWLVVAVRDGIA